MESVRVTVATTATEIVHLKAGGSIIIRVPSGGVTTYIGGADVTTSNGFAIGEGESVSYASVAGEKVYGIVASSTQVVHTLVGGEAS
jgi:hypothetical protein